MVDSVSFGTTNPDVAHVEFVFNVQVGGTWCTIDPSRIFFKGKQVWPSNFNIYLQMALFFGIKYCCLLILLSL